jgi:hypothetical protein
MSPKSMCNLNASAGDTVQKNNEISYNLNALARIALISSCTKIYYR